MKKLLYASLMAVAMLFAMPTIVRAQDEGGETGGEEMPKITVMLMDLGSSDVLSEEGPNVTLRYVAIGAMATAGQMGGGGFEPLAVGDDEEEASGDGIRIYYTYDADVTLSHAAYLSQTDGKILLAKGEGMAYIYTYTNEETATLRVLACMIQEGEEVEAMRSDISSYSLTFKEVPAPVFSETDGSAVVAGTTVTITNIPEEDAYVLYSTNGAMPAYMNQGQVEGITEYNNGIEVTGEVGSTFTIKAITYMDDEDMPYGSKMTTVTYTIKAEGTDPEPEAAYFTFDPEPTAEGLEAGTEITVAYSDAEKVEFINYLWFETAEAAKAASTEGEWKDAGFSTPVLAAETPALRVIAYDEDEEILADSVVVYTVKAAPAVPYFTLTPAPSEDGLEAGTEITAKVNNVDEGTSFFNFQWFADVASAKEEITMDDLDQWPLVGSDKIVLTAEKPVLRLIASDFDGILADSVVVYTVISDDPATFTVEADGAMIVMDEDTVVFTAIKAVFNMELTKTKIDKRDYVITDSLFEGTAYVKDDFHGATDTRVEYMLGEGSYKVVFHVYIVDPKTGAYDPYKDTTIYFRMVAPTFVDPELTVEAAGENEMNEGTVVFKGMASFRLNSETELAAGDEWNNYQVTGTLYTKAGYEAEKKEVLHLGYYEVKDPINGGAAVVEFADRYDGEYVIDFRLVRRNTGAELGDTLIFFNVTDYAEPVLAVDPELTVTPVGKHEVVGDTVVLFNEPAFLIRINDKVLIEGDTLSNYTLTYEFGPKAVFDFVEGAEGEMTEVVCAADTMDGKTITFGELEEGEYAVYIYLTRTNGQLPDILENSYTIYFNVTAEELAIEGRELAGVNVYPNPSNGSFNVAVPEKARIDIFGLNGAKVMSREVNAGVEAFNINHSGIYFVRVMAGNKTAVKRVVVR